MQSKNWTKFVDAVTIIWLIVFAIGLNASTEIIQSRCSLLNFYLLPIFVIDLVLLYRQEGDFRSFLKKRWFDILLVIPYFRIFRVFRMARLLRFLKILKLQKIMKFTRLTNKSKRTTKALKVNRRKNSEPKIEPYPIGREDAPNKSGSLNVHNNEI